RPSNYLNKQQATHHPTLLRPSGPHADHPLRHSAAPLALAIGDDSGSRLYWGLVDPGLADSADCSFHEYEGTGSFYTSFSCEPDRMQKNLQIVKDLLAETRKGSITEEELQQAKSKILSRVVRGSERPMGRMQAIGMSWTYLGTYRSVDDELNAFESVTLETVRQVLDIYPITKATELALGPLEEIAA